MFEKIREYLSQEESKSVIAVEASKVSDNAILNGIVPVTAFVVNMLNIEERIDTEGRVFYTSDNVLYAIIPELKASTGETRNATHVLTKSGEKTKTERRVFRDGLILSKADRDAHLAAVKTRIAAKKASQMAKRDAKKAENKSRQESRKVDKIVSVSSNRVPENVSRPLNSVNTNVPTRSYFY